MRHSNKFKFFAIIVYISAKHSECNALKNAQTQTKLPQHCDVVRAKVFRTFGNDIHKMSECIRTFVVENVTTEQQRKKRPQLIGELISKSLRM